MQCSFWNTAPGVFLEPLFCLFLAVISYIDVQCSVDVMHASTNNAPNTDTRKTLYFVKNKKNFSHNSAAASRQCLQRIGAKLIKPPSPGKSKTGAWTSTTHPPPTLTGLVRPIFCTKKKTSIATFVTLLLLSLLRRNTAARGEEKKVSCRICSIVAYELLTFFQGRSVHLRVVMKNPFHCTDKKRNNSRTHQKK